MHTFSQPISRSGTHSLKWELTHHDPQKPQVIPLWVADMDFPAPDSVANALQARAKHPIYGYSLAPKAYLESIADWHHRLYHRLIFPAEILLAPSVMHAMSMALRALTQPDEPILSLTPVYGPFASLVTRNQRTLVEVDLAHQRNVWHLDLPAIERHLVDAQSQGNPIRILLFCNPHNPTGRAWNRDELRAISVLAVRYGFTIFADEIHGDLYRTRTEALSFWDLLAEIPELAQYLIIFSGPNKTFNIAGLGISHIFCKSTKLLSTIRHALEADFFDGPNLMALTAAKAAYDPEFHNEIWLDQLVTQIHINKSILDNFFVKISNFYQLDQTQSILSSDLQATYLAWADFTPIIRILGHKNDTSFCKQIEEFARVKLGNGSFFRGAGVNHLRFNLATQSSILEQGLAQILHYLCKS